MIRVGYYGVEEIERDVSGGHERCILFQILPAQSDDFRRDAFFTGTTGECARYLKIRLEKERKERRVRDSYRRAQAAG